MYMKVVGLITEYNPFHNGHKYHIEKAKEITGADYVVAIMSGDFVQRGTPACVEKHTRAHMALVSGADLVLELPLIYSTGSAELFADGAVSILNGLGVVDAICFGCECGSVEPLMEIARILNNEPTWYSEDLQMYLKEGYSYPAARAAALPEYSDILTSPNNILGIEYCKAILKYDARIEPIGIQRMGSNYHDEELNSTFSSATAIRNILYNNNIDSIDFTQHIPANAADILTNELTNSGSLHEDDFSAMLLYKLLQAESHLDYMVYEDINEQLASRIFNLRTQFRQFSQFADLLKTKDITRTRANRCLLHILLNIRSSVPYATYARILGMNKDAAELFTAIKKSSSIPFFSKTANAEDILCKDQLELLNLTMQASMIYGSVISQKTGRPIQPEPSKSIVIIKTY